MTLIPLPYQILGVVAVVAAAFSFGYYKGIDAGRVAQLKDTVAAYETRTEIDANTSTLGDVDLCIALGGTRENCSASQ
jgi:hypothetical protein